MTTAAERPLQLPPRDTAAIGTRLLANLEDPPHEALPPTVAPTPSPEATPIEPQAVQPPLAEGAAEPLGQVNPVNIDELTAQIAGNNMALRALEAELDEPRHWDARGLGPLVDRLRGVVARAKDLTMFHEVMPQGERSLVGRPESPQPAVSQLAAKIFEARTHAAGTEFSGSAAHRHAELQYLDELSRELASIAMSG